MSALVPFVPRLAIEWLTTRPDDRFQEIEASLVLADLSGFTALSEKLARRGHVGTEELVRTINGCFSDLIQVAYEDGASLLKFGGDALLLVLTGSDHPARACRTAVRMRGRLQHFRQSASAPEAAELHISTGVHSGACTLFLVGGSHRELIVTGPAASLTVACETAAEADEIVISKPLAALLEPAVVGAAKGPGVLLLGEPAAPPLGDIPLVPQVTDDQIAALVPVALRAPLLATIHEPEHRDAVLAFVRFAGVDAVLDEQGIAATAQALESLVRSVQEAVDDEELLFNTADIDRDGGKLYLVAGAPRRSDRDEEKLLRAARTIADAPHPFPLHIGINRGHVFTGVVGAPFRKAYAVMGDSVNLAARLASRADAGQVIATPAVLDRSRSLFATEALEPFTVKGKREPVVAYSVGQVVGARSAPAQELLPLYGRERELALVQSALDAARVGRGALLELVGEAGLGKSRLVAELRRLAPDLPTYAVDCEPYQGSTPYFAFREPLRRLLGVAPVHDPAAMANQLERRLQPVAPEVLPWLPLLAVPLDVSVPPTRQSDEIDPAFRRARIHAVVRTVLTRLLTEPSLLIFEDVHWMDEASSELLRHLAEYAQSRPWLLCVSRRPETGGFAVAPGMRAVTIHLNPLTIEASLALVQATAPGLTVPAVELAVIAERAAGNPLFLRELVRARRAGVVEAPPETVQAVIAARIDRLQSEARTVLRYSSVLGRSFDQELVIQCLDGTSGVARDPAIWESLVEFIEVDLDGTCRFKHPLFREVAYEGLSFARRRQIHARVGEVLETKYAPRPEEIAEILSLHFALAASHQKTWTYSLVAGDEARAKHGNVEAAEFYRRALEAAPNLPDLDRHQVAAVWEVLGDVFELSANYSDAEAAYGTAYWMTDQLTGDRTRVIRKLGLLRDRQGRYPDALRWFRRGLRELDSLPDVQQRTAHGIELSLACAGTSYRQGHFRECIAWCERARSGAEATGDRSGLAHAHYLLHLAHTQIGSEDRVRYRDTALPIVEELRDPVLIANVLNNLGIDAYYEGRWDDALKLYQRSKEARERAGDVAGAATAVNNIAEVLSDQGHVEQAERLFHEARSMAEGFRLAPAVVTGNLGRAAARSGRFDEARQLLESAREALQALGAESFVLETRARQAELAVLMGDAEAALRIAEETLQETDRLGGMAGLAALLMRVRGWAFIQSAHLSEAADSLRVSLEAARRENAQYEAALTLQAQAALSRLQGEAAEETQAEAQRLLERLGVVRVPPIPLEKTSEESTPGRSLEGARPSP
jgi:class 3 adenylate cyclase/tetratricopeptide (TPR) repeat protein